MAEENEAQEKTEEPTQRRLEKAREDGQILSSKEVMVLASSLTGMLVLMGLGVLLPQILGHWSGFFVFDKGDQLLGQAVARLSEVAFDFVLATLAVGLPIMLVALGTQAGIGGVNFSGKALEFKGSRINPVAGLQRMFSVRSLVELAKSILKVALLGATAATVVWISMPEVITLASSSLEGAIKTSANVLILLFAVLVVVLAAIGILDYMWSQHEHMQKLRMSRQDMKDENKQSEGSPEVKQRIRRLQIEASRRAVQASKSLDSVPDARVILTNPTHFAVALKYNQGEAGAPVILAMGRGRVAEEIIARGKASGILIMRSPLLARALYFTGEIGQEIAEGLYTAVAAVLAYVYRLDQGEDLNEPDIDLPEDLRFSEDGRPLEKGARG